MKKNNSEILIKYPRNWGLSEVWVKKALGKGLAERGFGRNVEVSVIFVGQVRAKKLNQEYRQMNYIPQVLGFSMSKAKDADGMIRLGDIVICTQKLKYEAKILKKDIKDVLSDWLTHGLDNLLK